MKQKYEHPELDFVWISLCDIITLSPGETDDPVEDDDFLGGGSGIGGSGYDPGGWT